MTVLFPEGKAFVLDIMQETEQYELLRLGSGHTVLLADRVPSHGRVLSSPSLSRHIRMPYRRRAQLSYNAKSILTFLTLTRDAWQWVFH